MEQPFPSLEKGSFGFFVWVFLVKKIIPLPVKKKNLPMVRKNNVTIFTQKTRLIQKNNLWF